MAAANAAERKDTDGRLQSGNLRSQYVETSCSYSRRKSGTVQTDQNGDEQARELYIKGIYVLFSA